MNKTVEEQISEFLSNSQENIKAAYLKGYAVAKKEIAAEAQESEYKRGLDDAEKAIKKIFNEPSKGGLYANEAQEIFGTKGIATIFLNHSISEIVEKIRKYDEEKAERNASPDNELHIGDEVYITDKKLRAIVTAFLDNRRKANLLYASGNYTVIEISVLHKTGRRFVIDEILRELKGE